MRENSINSIEQTLPLNQKSQTQVTKPKFKKPVISNFLLELSDSQAEIEFENKLLMIRKSVYPIIRIYRMIIIGFFTIYILTNFRTQNISLFAVYSFPILEIIEIIYTLLVFLKWDDIKSKVSFIETILIVTENIIFQLLLADKILSSNDFKYEFSAYSFGNSTVLINLVTILAMDNYLLKVAIILSLNIYLFNQPVNFSDIFYIVCSDLVIILIVWMQQKKIKLVLYESYVKKQSFKNYKEYFHNTLSQPIVVFKLKNSDKSADEEHQPALAQNSLLEVLYCNQSALKDVCDQGNCFLENLPISIDGSEISFGTIIAQKIEECQTNNQNDSYKSYNFLQFGEENFVPATQFQIKQGIKEKVNKFYSVKWNSCIWEGQYGCILQISDLTLQHESAEKLHWQKINEYKDELLATVSHDLRTPLNSILTSTEAISHDSSRSEFEEHRDIVLNNALYLEHLISDIMDYSMISKGKLRIVPAFFQLGSLITNIIRLFADQCILKNIKLVIKNELNCDDEIQYTIFTNRDTFKNKSPNLYNDKKRITQILINLVSNALKFTSKGQITVRMWEEQGAVGTINLSVADTGCGIPYDIQPKLFEMFNTFDHDSGQNKHGVGLGLCISQKIARLVGPGDKIEMDSVPGEGTCFSFSIYKNLDQTISSNQQLGLFSDQQKDSRQYQQQEHNYSFKNLQFYKQDISQERIQSVIQNPEITMNLMGLKKPQLRKFAKIMGNQEQNILVVDDYPYNIRAVQILFKNSRFQIEGATSADSGNYHILKQNKILCTGIAMMKAKKYDLALFDVNMPFKDGLQLTREVRELILQNQLPDICIVQCTAYDTEQERNECLRAGADGFLSKPITYDQLINSVQTALEKFRSRQKN